MKKLIIFGMGDNAELAHFYFTNDSDYEVEAFTVDREHKDREIFCGLPVVPYDELSSVYNNSDYELFIAIGYSNMNGNRQRAFEKAQQDGWNFANYISSKASVFSTKIGVNNFILEDNTIQPFVTIGDNNVIWSGNHIGHHGEIGHNNFITSQVTISGRVKVVNNCFIGVNSSLRDHITISSFTLIGAHSWISKSTNEYEVYSAKQTPLFPKPSNRVKI